MLVYRPVYSCTYLTQSFAVNELNSQRCVPLNFEVKENGGRALR